MRAVSEMFEFAFPSHIRSLSSVFAKCRRRTKQISFLRQFSTGLSLSEYVYLSVNLVMNFYHHVFKFDTDISLVLPTTLLYVPILSERSLSNTIFRF